MNPAEKAQLKAQLNGVSSQLTAAAMLALSGSTMPVATAMGPAAAPGVAQMGAALQQQGQALTQLIGILTKIVDGC